ncbi:MAG TPA: (Fe-S)-binding protein [Candidatus Sumerlaeota bacterium]|nr:MAG: Anaerobic glycerol-3-phosphate dehydrogenase subunit C [candidate division BRC1 bacterium ADurb.Bin183]HOE63733.1 (Fe-S)-binding protein [Candidatus Sumerlaeota bacterium]HRR31660.1 (Fe-S)-binding protein [Candidatus Sumerlaeia bacterium]HON49502.1 (Fe-S)-binding protein [Candidatus Sumerlaeota bacterium]HOR64651.1 (Fe-S)-binding protein [Candidatus Sumerlaeota bacterium]
MAFIQEHEEDIVKCMKCGNCQETCPVYQITGMESRVARGRVRLIKAAMRGDIELTDGVQESLLTCLQCDACSVTCPPGVPVNDLMLQAKAAMLKKGKTLPESLNRIRVNIEGESNPFSQPKKERGAWLPPELRQPRSAKYLLHAGCAVSYAQSRIGKAVIRILQQAGVDFTLMGDREECCGDPLIRMGDAEQAELLIARNKALWKEFGIEYVITPCAGCFKAMKEHYADVIKPLHSVQFFDQLIKEGKLKFTKPFAKKVVYFDGCDIGRHGGVYEEPRDVLRAISGLTLLEFAKNRQNSVCCGGPLLGSYPELAKKIASERVREAAELGAEILAAACPTCLLNLKEGANLAGIKMDVQDVNALIMRAL